MASATTVEMMRGYLVAARDACEQRVMDLVEQGVVETDPAVVFRDHVVTAIEELLEFMDNDVAERHNEAMETDPQYRDAIHYERN